MASWWQWLWNKEMGFENGTAGSMSSSPCLPSPTWVRWRRSGGHHKWSGSVLHLRNKEPAEPLQSFWFRWLRERWCHQLRPEVWERQVLGWRVGNDESHSDTQQSLVSDYMQRTVPSAVNEIEQAPGRNSTACGVPGVQCSQVDGSKRPLCIWVWNWGAGDTHVEI